MIPPAGLSGTKLPGTIAAESSRLLHEQIKIALGGDQDLDRFCSSHTAVEFLAAFRGKRDLGILPNLDKIMEGRKRIAAATGHAAPIREAKKMVHCGAAVIDRRFAEFQNNRSLPHNKNGRRLVPSGYFSLESLFLLTCLMASLLILPLILPPLPPPPFMLLLLPIGILGMLMLLVFMPSEVRDLTRSCG